MPVKTSTSLKLRKVIIPLLRKKIVFFRFKEIRKHANEWTLGNAKKKNYLWGRDLKHLAFFSFSNETWKTWMILHSGLHSFQIFWLDTHSMFYFLNRGINNSNEQRAQIPVFKTRMGAQRWEICGFANQDKQKLSCGQEKKQKWKSPGHFQILTSLRNALKLHFWIHFQVTAACC